MLSNISTDEFIFVNFSTDTYNRVVAQKNLYSPLKQLIEHMLTFCDNMPQSQRMSQCFG